MSDIEARVLPHSLDAERAVLGAALLRNTLIDAVAEHVQPTDFYRMAHRTIFAHVLKLHGKGDAVDEVTLCDSLRTSADLDDVGGPVYIAALTDGLPHSTNAEHYARIVREKATLRETIAVASQAIADAYDAEDGAAAVINTLQQNVFEIFTNRDRGGFVPMHDVIQNDVYPLLERLQASKQQITGVPSGLIDLDYLTRGFQPQNLIIVAARPSMGKTSLVMNALSHAALDAGKHAAIYSLEMSRSELALRALVAESRIDGQRVQTGRIYEKEWPELTAAINRLSGARLHIDDSPNLTIHEIRSRARRLKALVGLDIIAIDYVQLMQAVGKTENRTLEISAMSRSLKQLAKELDVPIILLSQLSRACEARADKRPELSDLRDSGALEQDADVVIFIYRDEVYNENTDARGIAELIVRKQRNGPIGTVKVGFAKQHTRFFNLTERHA